MDGTVRLFDSTTGAETRSFDWSIGPVQAAAVSPDGTLCAAGGDDGHLVVWDVDARSRTRPKREMRTRRGNDA
jgi:WD40 repeat protein